MSSPTQVSDTISRVFLLGVKSHSQRHLTTPQPYGFHLRLTLCPPLGLFSVSRHPKLEDYYHSYGTVVPSA
ncbi:hypothetical protein RRG08_044241 [Elysia crispata]|uniref:Uncharacterized protein n=1 Tax=Elysia crispata TaxID=231223 RepID=A0AAE0XWX1_9GAST|nr:hypothetical protein RRG08_044241 [Elysia crispata]